MHNAESEGSHTSLGFSSQSYFTRVFRERTGFTPSVFRKRFFRESEMGGT
jgi:AraC-like DNA-binding protein